MEDLDAKEDFSYQEYPVKILDMSERVTRNKRVEMSNVQCCPTPRKKPLGKEKKN
jgi:hypothetical protein